MPDYQLLEADILKELGGKATIDKPLAWLEHGLTIRTKKFDLISVVSKLKADPLFSFNMLIDITAVDYLDSREDRFELVYQLLSLSHLHRICIKVSIPEVDAKIDSLRSLYSGAYFIEREIFDMYGIIFNNHGDLRRVLMYDEFVGHPLRKDYPVNLKQPRVELRLPEQHNFSQDMYKDNLVALPKKSSINQNKSDKSSTDKLSSNSKEG